MGKIQDALVRTQKKKAGFVNRGSVNYAESLLEPKEKVDAAVIATIKASHSRDSFPGVVAITDKRVLVTCGLPGMKRKFIFPIDEISHVEDAKLVTQYRIIISRKGEFVSFTLHTDMQDVLAPYVKKLSITKTDRNDLELLNSAK